jgi:hypothetical protein
MSFPATTAVGPKMSEEPMLWIPVAVIDLVVELLAIVVLGRLASRGFVAGEAGVGERLDARREAAAAATRWRAAS